MIINRSEHTISELTTGYRDSGENGIVAFNGLLNVRPAYQREFVYDDEKRAKVIQTVLKGYPINVFYWGRSENGGYELIDGQQRTISICQYVKGVYSIDYNGVDTPFLSLPYEKQQDILNYQITVFKCEGTEEETLAWFETINVAGEKLTKQELRNSVFTGMWLSSAKQYFSKTGCVASQFGKEYMSGSPLRQEYLEEVLKWASDKEGFKKIEGYMSAHRFDENADELFTYYKEVINWVRSIFGAKAEKDMSGIHWGILYNKYKDTFTCLNTSEFQNRIKALREDDEVTRKSGVYEYLLSGETAEKCLSIRKFPDKIVRKIYNQQLGKCKFCGKDFALSAMEADHIIPWSKGGHTDEGNCQMLCVQCNRSKGNKG